MVAANNFKKLTEAAHRRKEEFSRPEIANNKQIVDEYESDDMIITESLKRNKKRKKKRHSESLV